MSNNQSNLPEEEKTLVNSAKKQNKAVIFPSIKNFVTENYPLIKKLATVVGVLSGGVGIIGNIWIHLLAEINADKIQIRKDLSSFSTYGAFVHESNTNIQPAIGRLIKKLDNTKRQYNLTNFSKIENCKTLLEKETNSQTGMELFYSDKFKDFRIIHNFYESLGLVLDKELINFETVFDLFVFPTYWDLNKDTSDLNEDTSNLNKDTSPPDFAPLKELRDCVGNTWFGFDKNKQPRSLSDFSYYLNQMGFNYHYYRLKDKYKNVCKYGHQEKETQCIKIKNKLDQIKDRKNINKPWQKLYPNICEKNWYNKFIVNECRN